MTNSDNDGARDGEPAIRSCGLFKALDFTESRKGFFGTSVVVHAVLLCVLLVIPLIYTDTIKVKFNVVLTAPTLPKKESFEPLHYQRVQMQEPVIQRKQLPPPPPPKPILVEPPEVRLREVPQIARLKQPEISEPDKPVFHPAETPVPAPKMPEVRIGTFTTDSAAPQTAGHLAQTVQTGGFGDQPGSKATGHSVQTVQTGGFGDQPGSKGAGRSAKIAEIASLGSFDLTDAANAHNGRSPERAVHQSGFGDVEASAKPEPPKKRPDFAAAATPVEILFKPKPDYTDKARTAKVEGEVLLRVLFSAMGDVRVLDVVRGLGYGLDENAGRAAQQIKFRPAQRDGQPVDSTATVRIVFQLAY
jgi:TonB family protein